MHRVPDGKLLPERIDAFVALCGCRLLKQFADLPRLDFWRLVKQIKSQMSLFRIFPPPLCPTSYRWVVLFSPVEPQCSRSKTASRPCTLSATGVVASARTYVSPASPPPTPSALSPMGKCQNTQHGRPKPQRRTPQLLMISSQTRIDSVKYAGFHCAS